MTDGESNRDEIFAPGQEPFPRDPVEEDLRVLKKIHKGWQPQTKAPETARNRGHETVLLVDDDPMVLGAIKVMLELLGHRVLEAETPSEAIRLSEKHIDEIRLLVTDVVMPEMNGWNLAKILLARHPDLNLLFMSGYTPGDLANLGVPHGYVAFIKKPFSLDELAAKMSEVML